MADLTLYCNCFPLHENLKTQFNQKNLMCGSADINSSYRTYLQNKNFYFDDTGDNISHLNKWVGDLTGLYWVWKNTSDEFVGTNQYRRYYDTNQINSTPLNDNTIYISAPVGFSMSTAQQYTDCHGKLGLDILKEAANKNVIPITSDMIDKLYVINNLSACNMFFAHRELFNRMCQVLFDTVLELYEGVKYSLPYIQPIDTAGNKQYRMLAFLAERICTIIYMNSRYFFGDIKIEPIGWEFGPK